MRGSHPREPEWFSTDLEGGVDSPSIGSSLWITPERSPDHFGIESCELGEGSEISPLHVNAQLLQTGELIKDAARE